MDTDDKSNDNTADKLNASCDNTLDVDEIHFYSQMLDSLIKNPDQDELMRTSLLESINESENLQNLLKDTKVSFILDIIVPHFDPPTFKNIMKTLEENLRMYAVHCCSSHVLETVLKCCLKYLQHSQENSIENDNATIEDRKYVKQFLVQSCKFVYNNIVEFITEYYASHVLRTVIEVISGKEVKRNVQNKNNLNKRPSLWNSSMIVPKELQEVLPGFIERLCNLPNLPDLIKNTCASAVLQCTLSALDSFPDGKKLLKKLVNSIINNGLTELSHDGEVHEVFMEEACCRLLEVILTLATDKQQKYIYDSFFKHKLQLLCSHKSGKYAVENLCDHIKNPEVFKEIYLAVTSSIEVRLENVSARILYSLVKTCKRLESNQSSIIKYLMKILKCVDSGRESFIMLLLKFVEFEDSEKLEEYPFQYYGVVIVEELICFKKSKIIVDSVLDMTDAHIMKVACHAQASYIINTFFECETIQHQKKKQLVDRFEEMEVQLSCSKSGSRSLEVIWNFADLETKKIIANRLLKAKNKLNDNYYGRIIFFKFHLNVYNTPDVWTRNINTLHKKRNMREELLAEFKDTHKKIKLD